MSTIEFQRRMIARHPRILTAGLAVFNALPFNNRVRVSGKNRLVCRSSLLSKCRIIVSGTNNVITIDSFSRLMNTVISISGNNNRVEIGSYCTLIQGDICVEDDGNTVVIGAHTSINGKTHLACIEGTSIEIGERCMFSSDVTVRTGDSHSIMDMAGLRVNPSESVVIGEHVWVGNKTMLLKGARISDNSIVGAGAVVTGKFPEANVVIAGVPAAVISRDKQWDINRV